LGYRLDESLVCKNLSARRGYPLFTTKDKS
jgi:hypothetical protein